MIELHNVECLEFMRGMDANSVDAIVTDPPYFGVKDDDWDNQWKNAEHFIAWIVELSEQWQRILKPNGSLYCFASPRMAARVEVKIAERFNILPTIVWMKQDAAGNGISNRSDITGLRSFFPQSERIIFAEHYGADNIAKGEAGYTAKCDQLRGFVFEPLRAYLVDEFNRSGIDKIQFNVICGFSASAGGMASRHYLSQSQWCLPTFEHYHKLREATGRFQRPYEDLRREYEDLRREYEDLRRPFNVTADVPYTDVWTFKTVQAYEGKHVCEKPLALMEHIILASTRPNALVFDPFTGSGSTGVAAVLNGRRFIGCEKDAKHYQNALRRIRKYQSQPRMFAPEPPPKPEQLSIDPAA